MHHMCAAGAQTDSHGAWNISYRTFPSKATPPSSIREPLYFYELTAQTQNPLICEELAESVLKGYRCVRGAWTMGEVFAIVTQQQAKKFAQCHLSTCKEAPEHLSSPLDFDKRLFSRRGCTQVCAPFQWEKGIAVSLSVITSAQIADLHKHTVLPSIH